MTLKTNNQPRPVVDAWELSPAEREEFDYHDWAAIERGEDSASFFRYKGELYDLGEFTTSYGILKDGNLPDELSAWDGYMSESAFSALVVRYVRPEYDSVVVGYIYH